MTVLAFDNASDAVRGELTRWFLELKPGVFVGNVNARIRDLLWSRLCEGGACRGVVLVYSDRNEQGYSMRMYGAPDRRVVDIEGVQLICRTNIEKSVSDDVPSERRGEIDEYPATQAEQFTSVLQALTEDSEELERKERE